MNEQGFSPEANGQQSETLTKEELEETIDRCVNFIKEKRADLFGHLAQEEMEELTEGIQSLTLLDPRLAEEPEAIETELTE